MNRMVVILVIILSLNISCDDSVVDISREGMDDVKGYGVEITSDDGISGGEDINISWDNGETGVDVVRDERGCISPCECRSGEVCFQGECINWDQTAGPHLFCCTDPQCQVRSNCVYPDGRYGTCPENGFDAGMDIFTDTIDGASEDSIDAGIDMGADAGVEDIYETGVDISYTIVPPLAIEVSPDSMGAAVQGQRYEQTVKIIATGGNPPYKYSCSIIGTPVNELRAYVSGDSCLISGTPSESNGYIINFTVTDSSYGIATKSLSVKVISPNCLPSKINSTDAEFYIHQDREEIKLIKVEDNCGNSLDYNAEVMAGAEWLSIVSTKRGVIELKISSKGKSVNKYSGKLHISSGSLAGDLNIIMYVMQGCEVKDAKVDENMYRKVMQGKYLPYDVVEIVDNCGNSLEYVVNKISGGWIASPYIGYSGNGRMEIHYDTSALTPGTYEGIIDITITGYGQRSIKIHLEVTNKGPPSITRLTDNTRVRFKLGPKEYIYFYFITASVEGDDLNVYLRSLNPKDILEVRLEPYANAYYGGDMLVRYAGPNCDWKLPTLDELNTTWQQDNLQPRWYADYKNGIITGYSWHPQRWRDDLYYKLAENAFEAPLIGGDPHYPLGCWYILVYNDDRLQQGYTDLYISFREYTAVAHGPGY